MNKVSNGDDRALKATVPFWNGTSSNLHEIDERGEEADHCSMMQSGLARSTGETVEVLTEEVDSFAARRKTVRCGPACWSHGIDRR